LIIAIDGPAGSGKSTTARAVAERLGYLYLDTGAMYRALTHKALKAGIDLKDSKALADLARRTSIELERRDHDLIILLDGANVSEEIRSPEVTASVSVVSEYPEVREVMVQKQRRLGVNGGIVAEGRDIGTVVFPEAEIKVFMTASLEERARRRYRDYQAWGVAVDLEALRRDIERRDEHDSKRATSPLRPAADAMILDTTSLTIEGQVERILQRVRELQESVSPELSAGQ